MSTDGEDRPPDPAGSEARRTVASYSSYQQAERAVDFLSDQKFPVERVAIVARDLKLVEQVTGRVGYTEAALQGAGSGAIVGVLIGWLFGVFDWFNPVLSTLWLAFQGLWFGAVVGALLGLLFQALKRGRRDFGSISAVSAGRYEVRVDEEVADEAARLLGELGSAPAAADEAAGRHGSRPGGEGPPLRAA
jgi:hypothetical protein